MSRGHYSHSVQGLRRSRELVVEAWFEEVCKRQQEILSKSIWITPKVEQEAMLKAVLELIYNKTKRL